MEFNQIGFQIWKKIGPAGRGASMRGPRLPLLRLLFGRDRLGRLFHSLPNVRAATSSFFSFSFGFNWSKHSNTPINFNPLRLASSTTVGQIWPDSFELMSQAVDCIYRLHYYCSRFGWLLCLFSFPFLSFFEKALKANGFWTEKKRGKQISFPIKIQEKSIKCNENQSNSIKIQWNLIKIQ